MALGSSQIMNAFKELLKNDDISVQNVILLIWRNNS